ncbi:hypothetical protein HPP92_014904 [Vanilla planifolia]|uniref:Uncharacterized protein n=1 Tax=Vanilla planifolia TaxID=51239 RepID=A0A835UT58_VANPL|nr:hypothetical protein HPP92_014904 [Vanilla planifolia]
MVYHLQAMAAAQGIAGTWTEGTPCFQSSLNLLCISTCRDFDSVCFMVVYLAAFSLINIIFFRQICFVQVAGNLKTGIGAIQQRCSGIELWTPGLLFSFCLLLLFVM